MNEFIQNLQPLLQKVRAFFRLKKRVIGQPFEVTSSDGSLTDLRPYQNEWFLMTPWQKLDYWIPLLLKVLFFGAAVGLFFTFIAFENFPSLEDLSHPEIYSCTITFTPVLLLLFYTLIRFGINLKRSWDRGKSEDYQKQLEQTGYLKPLPDVPGYQEKINIVLRWIVSLMAMLYFLWTVLK